MLPKKGAVIMALTPAEKMRAYRERQKANKQKPVSFLLDCDIAEKVTSYAERHQTTQADVFNNLLRQGLDSNKLPNNDAVTSYQEQLKELSRKNEILQIDKENLERDIFNMNARNTTLGQELKTAKANGNKLPSNTGALLAELEELKRKNTFLSEQIEMDKAALIRSNTQILKCQCSTKAGRQCLNNATHETKHGSFYIAVCGQHFKDLSA